MLNLKLRDSITLPEFRLLYDSKINITDKTFKKALQLYIKNIRATIASPNSDPLKSKLEKLGNTGGWYKEKCVELTAALYDFNKSTISTETETLGKWRSIEFELVFKAEDSMRKFADEARQKGYYKCVVIKDDHSLRADDDDGNGHTKEVVVSYTSGNEQVVYDVCQLMSKYAYVNNSCGTHVHFDMRTVDAKQAQQYGRRLARCVNALRSILPVARRNNRHCATTINSIKNEGRRQTDRNDRYAFVNLQAYNKYKTIEVRGHSGTINAEKILNWIKICEVIMTTRIRSKLDEINDPMELIKLYHFDEPLSQYIVERYNKFNPREVPTIVAE